MFVAPILARGGQALCVQHVYTTHAWRVRCGSLSNTQNGPLLGISRKSTPLWASGDADLRCRRTKGRFKTVFLIGKRIIWHNDAPTTNTCAVGEWAENADLGLNLGFSAIETQKRIIFSALAAKVTTRNNLLMNDICIMYLIEAVPCGKSYRKLHCS